MLEDFITGAILYLGIAILLPDIHWTQRIAGFLLICWALDRW